MRGWQPSDEEILHQLMYEDLGTYYASEPPKVQTITSPKAENIFQGGPRWFQPGEIVHVPARPPVRDHFWLRTALWMIVVLQAFYLGLKIGSHG